MVASTPSSKKSVQSSGKKSVPVGTITRKGVTATVGTPRSNKVADEALTGGMGAPQFGDTPTSRPAPLQLGRHAGSNSIGSEDDIPNSGRKLKKAGRTLAPSNAQRKRHSMSDGGPPKKSSTKDYVASRVWKNESTMTFGMRVKLAEQPHLWADAAFAATNIVDVWEHYDADKDDKLGRHEVQTLASDLVDRYVSLYKDQLLVDQPALTPQELEKLLRKDIFPHMLPGESIVESKRIMAERLHYELDLDHDGTITKTEFFFGWKNISKQWLTLKPPKGGLSCIIL